MGSIITSRRGLLVGLGAILAAPAIVRASSIMPVKAFKRSPQWYQLAIVQSGEDLIFFVDGREISRMSKDIFALTGETWVHDAEFS